VNDVELLALEAAAIFVLDGARILRRSSPDAAPGPRVHLKGSEEGNVLHLSMGVGEATAAAIEALAAAEPPLSGFDDRFAHVDDYLALVSAEERVDRWEEGLLWSFPNPIEFDHPARLICSDTPVGEALLQQLERGGMPEALSTAGFKDVHEFWWPWCAALDGSDIAAVAFGAGLGPESAEVGVYTVPASRGRGFAAAATAGWASLPALQGRALFYGTSRTNVSSQRVAQRLGLRFLGSTLVIW
jgi:hypothetical protein